MTRIRRALGAPCHHLGLGLGLLAAAVVAVYWPVGGYGFVDYDDQVYVFTNPNVLAGLSLAGCRWALTTTYFANWHPLTWLSFQLDASIWGSHAPGFHVTNLVLHVFASVGFAAFLWRATGRHGASLAAAGLFALHPLRVESVAWISERKDVLSGALAMATLCAYLSWAQRGGRRRYWLSVVLFILGLAAKPMLVTLPAVLLLLDIWPLRRVRGFDANDRGAVLVVDVRRALLEKVPFAVASCGVALATVAAQRDAGATPIGAVGLGIRVENALVALARYLKKLWWPNDLAVFYPHPAELGGPGWSKIAVLGAAALLLSLTALVVWRRREQPYLSIGWFLFLGTLTPVLGVVVQVGAQSMADRYTYLPSTGIAIAVAWAMDDLVRRGSVPRRVVLAGTVAILLALGVTSRRQLHAWASTADLASHAVSVTERNWRMETLLGRELLKSGDATSAAAVLEEAVAHQPKIGHTRLLLAQAYRRSGRPEAAARALEPLSASRPDDVALLRALADAREAAGESDLAADSWRALLALQPDDWEAKRRLERLQQPSDPQR